MSRFDTPESEEYNRKRREALDWRSSNNNRLEDFDSNFKLITEAEKLRRESQIKQAGQQLTKQQINARIQRMDIILESVKNGTYTNPS